MQDADAYFEAYQHAIARISTNPRHRDIHNGAGISVKLSALHPRYELLKRKRMIAELAPACWRWRYWQNSTIWDSRWTPRKRIAWISPGHHRGGVLRSTAGRLGRIWHRRAGLPEASPVRAELDHRPQPAGLDAR